MLPSLPAALAAPSLEAPPLVTLGVASYNNSRYITATLDSIKALAYPHKELLVVDDASSDDSVRVVEQWVAAHPDVSTRFIRHETNQGLCRVCNRIMAEARGEFVAMIGSDDLYKPQMLSVMVPALQQAGQQCAAVYADCELIDREGQTLSASFLRHFDARFGPNYPAGNIRVALLRGFYLPAATVLLRRAAVLQTGPYDSSLLAEDLDMWLRLCEHWTFGFVPEVVSAYRIHQLSVTQANKPGLNETFFRIYRKTKFVTEDERAAAKHMLADHAEHYYNSRGASAAPALWFAFRQTHKPKMLTFWLLARLGVQYATLRRLLGR